MGLLDSVVNRKLKRDILGYNSIFVFGDKGAGKSSLLALASTVGEDRPIFSNYPIMDCYQIPTIAKKDKSGVITIDTDKDWLYTTNFPRGSLILLDEVSTMYPARKFKDWSDEDSKFFNFLRKEDLHLILGSQLYDQVDLNVKRACDLTMFIHKRDFLSEFSYIEVSKSMTVKVADNSTEILGKDYRKGARLVSYAVGEIPLGTLQFYRKPYYDKFDTNFVPYKKIDRDFSTWNSVLEHA